LQELGRNFVNPIPAVDNPARAGARVNLAVVAPTSKSSVFSILPGVSFEEFTKRARQPSTLPGIQVIGSMLLGEYIHIFILSTASWFFIWMLLVVS
jgi:hypothetical protein